MIKRPVQQKDIAKLLKVSVMTVSKALRDHPDISELTKRRVRETAERIGYRLNLVARHLSSRRTHMIGVVLPKIAHSFYSQVLDGIYAEAKRRGYQAILGVSQEDAGIEQENIQNLMSMRVDGLLVSVTEQTSSDRIFRAVRDTGIPLVFFDRVRKLPYAGSVTVDNYGGAMQAVEYAIASGYTRIGYIGGSSQLEISQQRRAGYMAAMLKHHLSVCRKWIVECPFGERGGEAGFMSLWSQNDRPELIFTVSDSVAMGVYKAARSRGLRIPEDMSIIGFSDIESASLVTPALTTVHEPAKPLGRTATTLLIDRIEGKEKSAGKSIVLETRLEVRESCPPRNITGARVGSRGSAVGLGK